MLFLNHLLKLLFFFIIMPIMHLMVHVTFNFLKLIILKHEQVLKIYLYPFIVIIIIIAIIVIIITIVIIIIAILIIIMIIMFLITFHVILKFNLY